MAYVTVPKDLTKVKSKVMFNLTKRQLICFTPAVLLGVPLFFLTRGVLGKKIYENKKQTVRINNHKAKKDQFTATNKIKINS